MCDVIFESFIKPNQPIVSYLTPLTGITSCLLVLLMCREKDLVNAPSLEECCEKLRQILPKDAILVGQEISHGVTFCLLLK